MNDEQIKQRIKYLVEHGGIYDDPIREAQRWAKRAVMLACASVSIDLVFVYLMLR